MERKVNEEFSYNEKKLKVVRWNGCQDCFFSDDGCIKERTRAIIGDCAKLARKDKTAVMFVEVVKKI